MRSGIKSTPTALKVPGSLISLKYSILLRCNHKGGQIQSGTREPWAWSAGQVRGHLGQWESPYSCAAETRGTGHSLTHICIPCEESNSVPAQGPSNPPSWSLPQRGTLRAVEGPGTASMQYLSNLQALGLTWDMAWAWLKPTVYLGWACHIHSCRKPFMNGVSI